MADLLITRQIQAPTVSSPTTPAVYTVPATKTAVVLFANIANTSTPPKDIEFTMRWYDHSDGTGETYEWLVAVPLASGAVFRGVLGDGFTLHANDRFEVLVITADGQADVTLAVNETP